ncbi:MAG: ABC transporter permease [Oscillospiraceae bacterium]|jgi:putative ABC transport system permease protein|nr:ABC transporter permease [Oscillospiraceae bacterium]
MKLTAKLALSQIKTQKGHTIMTVLGIALSSAMLTATAGLVLSTQRAFEIVLGRDSYTPARTAALIAVGCVFATMIIAASVIVVSNAFRMSASERTRQFGILKSVGATKKQIAESVIYEGVFLSVIGIPLGVIAGLLVELFGISVANNSLGYMYESNAFAIDIRLPFAVSPLMFLLAVAVSFVTVILSAWRPARKAANIAAIDAVRAKGEVKIKNARTSKLTAKLFGFEGALAAKSVKRSRRGFRATVVSLTISIVLVMVAGAFSAAMNATIRLAFPVSGITAFAQFSSPIEYTYGDDSELENINYSTIDAHTAEKIIAKLREYNGVRVSGVGMNNITYTVTPPEEMMTDKTRQTGILAHGPTRAILMMVDGGAYAGLCEKAGVPVGSNILLNTLRFTSDRGKTSVFTPYNFAKQTLTLTGNGAPDTEITLDGVLSSDEIPAEMLSFGQAALMILVPRTDANVYHWYTNAKDSTGFAEYAKSVMAENIGSDKGLPGYYHVSDIATFKLQQETIAGTVMFFVYGFVGMLALIALTSVISTISTNLRARRREFAVLRSVGMTSDGIRKMLNLESVISSARSLLYGLPIGLLCAYGLYSGMRLAAEIPFRVPWLAVAGCVVGIFSITWVTMRFAASRTRKSNLIETIRREGV